MSSEDGTCTLSLVSNNSTCLRKEGNMWMEYVSILISMISNKKKTRTRKLKYMETKHPKWYRKQCRHNNPNIICWTDFNHSWSRLSKRFPPLSFVFRISHPIPFCPFLPAYAFSSCRTLRKYVHTHYEGLILAFLGETKKD